MDGIWDRDGNPIDELTWARLNADLDYKCVDFEAFADGTEVSTVWLGIDTRLDVKMPLIFETMIFPGKRYPHQECYRWPTVAAAIGGHDQAVAQVRNYLEQRQREGRIS